MSVGVPERRKERDLWVSQRGEDQARSQGCYLTRKQNKERAERLSTRHELEIKSVHARTSSRARRSKRE